MPTPPEKMPREYSQEIVTRTMEDVYSKIGSLDAIVDAGMDDVYKEMGNTNDRISSLEGINNQDAFASHPPMPVPTNVVIWKVPLTTIFIITCDPVDIIQYPLLEGFQFFASREKDFTPLMETGISTVTGVHDGGDDQKILTITAVLSEGLGTSYIDMPLWSDMNLNTNSAILSNLTDSSTVTMATTCWDKNDPLKITNTVNLSGGNDDTWQDGDRFSFKVSRVPNLVGQGPLPFAIYLAPLLSGFDDPQWDADSLYVKVRTYGQGRYSQLLEEDTAGGLGNALTAPTVSAIPDVIAAHIAVYWIRNYPPASELDVASWKIYRTLTTDPPDDDTNLIKETTDKFLGTFFTPFLDTDFSYNQQYYYWVRAVNTDGKEGDLGGPDGALMGKPQNPEIYNGEAHGNPLFFLQDWKVQWVIPDGCEESAINATLVGAIVPGWPMHTPFSITNGTHNGEYIQEFIIPALLVGETYRIDVIAKNNPLLTDLWSDVISQEYTITTTGSPDPPS